MDGHFVVIGLFVISFAVGLKHLWDEASCR